MKNTLWIGRTIDGKKQYTNRHEIELDSEGNLTTAHAEIPFGNYSNLDLFGLNLRPGEIVQVIIDTDKGTFEVIRQRERGWYLTYERHFTDLVIAQHWNGKNWCADRKDRRATHFLESDITVISDKLPFNAILAAKE